MTFYCFISVNVCPLIYKKKSQTKKKKKNNRLTMLYSTQTDLTFRLVKTKSDYFDLPFEINYVQSRNQKLLD